MHQFSRERTAVLSYGNDVGEVGGDGEGERRESRQEIM